MVLKVNGVSWFQKITPKANDSNSGTSETHAILTVNYTLTVHNLSYSMHRFCLEKRPPSVRNNKEQFLCIPAYIKKFEL
jgi:hypothetical protein